MPTRFTEIHISSPVSTPVPAGKTGDLATRRGAGDQEGRAEWTTVSRYRSAPVVVDAGSRKEWEPPTLLAALCELHAPDLGASSMASSPATRTCVCYQEHTFSCRCFAGEKQQVQEFARDAESLPFSYWPAGCASHCRILHRKSPADAKVRRLACSWRLPTLFLAVAGCGRHCAALISSELRRVCSRH